MLDKMNDLYKQMLDNYEGGLSNTSTKKFDGIVSAIAELLDIPVAEVYATGSGTRPGNLEVRLSQGVRATTHTTVGLGFIIDDKNDPENVEKLTNSALVTCEKFLGRGKAHYDNIVIFVESNGTIVASGIIFQKKTDITKKLIDELQINIIREVSTPSGISEIKDIHNSHLNYLTALRTKPFMLLAGISGTGKSRIVRKLAQASVTEELQRKYDPKSVAKGFNRWELHKPANFELIQVKPNWHNSLEVVGYKSNIGGAHYEYTPFVEFVVRAWKHPEIPFFLCLDEMNLAPVEQYFAEFLSAIESRSIENGEYETDPIIKPFDEFGKEVSEQMIDHLVGTVGASSFGADSIEEKLAKRFRTKGLTLPQNLLVMGTVNMDETTFSFSRKVLDRAMSVVMNEVEYDKFFSGESENDVEEMDDNTRKLLIDRPIRGLEAEDNEADAVKDYLMRINEKLNDTPFKLGYRAANEALLYVSASHMFNADSDVNSALDDFTLMKILSRIEGDKRSIGDLLVKLQEVITAEKYPKSYDKLFKMSETLKDQQFVSYWT
jgi:hypothetical protein